MSQSPDIVTHGLEQARLALTNIIGLTNIHLKPLTLKRSLKQKASGRLKQLVLDRQRTGPVPAAPFLARVSALYKVLEKPEVYAKRLARSLDRQRKRGDPKPVALPMASAYRLRPELGMIATALPGLLSAALEKWENSS